MTTKRIMLGVPCFAESRELLESSLRSFMEVAVDVVAVDNGGGPDVKAVLGEMEPLITVLRNPENVYVNPSWSQLAAHFLASESEILLLANADLIAAPNWSTSLLMRRDHSRAAGDREYWLGRALSTEAESLVAQTPSTETVEYSAGGSVSGAFFAMTREAVSLVFPIPPELLIHCGDDWVHLLLAEAGFRQLILRDVAVWHKGFVSGSRLPEFSTVIERDRLLWDSHFSGVCKSLGEIERQYVACKDAPSDINEHIPVLSRYAKGCESVTELGAGRSTWGLIHGRPKRLRSYDIRDAEMGQQRRVTAAVGIDFAFRQASSLSITIDETDLLFIDTIHNYEHLRQELALHGPKTRKRIVMHDTETFGTRDEVGPGPGLWPAVEEFLAANPDWQIESRLRNNNGLTVLARGPDAKRPLTLVSSFFRLSDRTIDEDAYFRWFDQLAASGLPILLFLDEQLMDRAPKQPNVRVVPANTDRDLWSFSLAKGRELKLPSHRDKEKDTRDFLILINAKIDMLEWATELDDRSTHFAWIDFGIMKVVKDPASFLARLGNLSPSTPCVLAPGCWTRDRADKAGGAVNWRFCGGFLLADRGSVDGLVKNYRTEFADRVTHRGRLTWEVNVWAEMERAGQRFDWYQADHDDSIIGGSPRICLSMIVKNEAAIIERCLDWALPFIDTWVIADTGSTDDTVERIERFFAAHSKPGKIVRFPFKNFAQARNEALAAARTVPGWDYALLLDADMQVDGEVDTDKLSAPAYKLAQREGTLEYWNTRLLRRDAPASYVGVTHEFLSVEGATNLPGLFVVDRADGGSKGDKGDRDIRLLSEYLTEHPTDERSMFYLAQTYRGMGRHHEAIQWYRRRVERGGWDEEVWASLNGIACSYRDLGDEVNLLKAAMDAYNFRPTRGEPLKLVAQFYRVRGKNEAALVFAEALATVRFPTDELFVERDVYDVGADQEISIAGYWSKIPARREAGYRACVRLTTSPYQWIREEARKNATHYAKSATELFGAEVRPIEWSPGDGYAPMNPSACVGADGRRLVLVRTVNYTVTSQGQYPTVDGSGIIKTRNHVLEMDAEWRPIRSTLVEDISGVPRSTFGVEGFEDCRIWQDGDRYFASATVRDLADNADGRCEVAILRLDEAWRVTDVRPVRDYEGDKTQKNWMPVAGRPGKFLYLCDPTIVIDTAFGTTTEIARHKPTTCLTDLRGGSQLVEHEDGWLCVTHEVAWRPERVYLHRFVKFDRDFRVVALSDPFFFARVGIEFCAGLARDGDRLVASFGVNDASAHLALFDPDAVSRALRPLP